MAADCSEKVKELLHDESAPIRAAAVRAFGRLGIPPEQCATSLSLSLCEENGAVRRAALETLLQIGDAVLGFASSTLLQHLKVAHQQGNTRTVKYAIFKIIQLGKEGETATMELLRHSDYTLRIQALWVLGITRPPTIARAKIAAQLLSDEDWEVTRVAAEALGHMGTMAVASVPKLQQLRRHRDRGVSRAAELALTRIAPNVV